MIVVPTVQVWYMLYVRISYDISNRIEYHKIEHITSCLHSLLLFLFTDPAESQLLSVGNINPFVSTRAVPKGFPQQTPNQIGSNYSHPTRIFKRDGKKQDWKSTDFTDPKIERLKKLFGFGWSLIPLLMPQKQTRLPNPCGDISGDSNLVPTYFARSSTCVTCHIHLYIYICTPSKELTFISHLGKRKIIFRSDLGGDIVSSQEGTLSKTNQQARPIQILKEMFLFGSWCHVCHLKNQGLPVTMKWKKNIRI